MNHVETMIVDNSHWPRPFIDGASVVKVTGDGTSFLPGNEKNRCAISISFGADCVDIAINDDLIRPLVIAIYAIHKLNIVIKSGVKAHVLFDVEASSQVHMHLEEHAHVDVYCGSFSSDGLKISQGVRINLDNDARLRLFEVGLLTDNTARVINVELNGLSAHASYFGLDQLLGHARKDSRLVVSHRAQKTVSDQVFRGVYAGSAQGSFLGKVVIEKDASLSKARQLYKAIIVIEKDKAHVMPQLEINNNDITASHGASIGELDKNILFYLCSRGVPASDAKTILVTSLLRDILDQIDDQAIKSAVSAMVLRSIEQALSVQL